MHDCKTIYEYEKKMRTYITLVHIKKKEEMSKMKKAESFVNGLANTKYHEVAKEIRTQLGNIKVNKTKSSPFEYEINHITLSILQLMKNNPFYNETKVFINNMQDEDNMSEDESCESTNNDPQAFYVQGNRKKGKLCNKQTQTAIRIISETKHL